MSTDLSVVRRRAASIRQQWTNRRKYVHTEQTDALIREAYRRFMEFNQRKAIANAARKIGWPKHAITQRAKYLGLSRTKEKPWSQEEEDLLETWGWMCLRNISMKLRKHGFQRSETAIHLKMKRLKIRSNLDGWTMRKLAGCFGVDDHKVSVWIQRGLLKAKPTGIVCGANQKMFIHRDDVRRFILHHPEEIDIAKCEKYWLLDVVSGGKVCDEFVREVA